jgi:hypothetical protein
MTQAAGPLPDMGRVAMAVPSPGGDPGCWVGPGTLGGDPGRGGAPRRQEDAGSMD